MRKRPADLPDFRNPPLNEVVLGIQFSPAPSYQQIYAGDVWKLFKPEYPHVEEHQPLVPTFETFGTPSGQPFGFPPMQFVGGAMHDRYWFLSENRDELIQFQADRLLHNWRKVEDLGSEYPRFEKMITKFEDEIKKIEEFLKKFGISRLSCNQVEVSYINIIPLQNGDVLSKVTDWLNIFNFGEGEPNEINASFREMLYDDKGQPRGRLICDTVVAIQNDKPIIGLNLTVKGRPLRNESASAIDFLVEARENIVKKFKAITTDSAHATWDIVK